MNASNRMMLWSVLLVVCLGMLVYWSYGQMLEKKRIALAASQDAVTCQAIADYIQQLRAAQPEQLDQASQMNLVVEHLQDAARSAELSMDRIIDRIRPIPARRIGNTAYMEQLTHVTLSNVNMQQLLTMLHAVSAKKTGLHIRQININPPRKPSDRGQWQVAVTLVAYIHQPTEKNGRAT